jgi:hypothetical protein
VLKVGSFLRNPFSFLFARSSAEEHVAAYLLREHARGRSVAEIVTDPFVQNRLTREQQARMLDRPEIIRRLGEQDIESARQILRG